MFGVTFGAQFFIATKSQLACAVAFARGHRNLATRSRSADGLLRLAIALQQGNMTGAYQIATSAFYAVECTIVFGGSQVSICQLYQ